ncbi:hypothetical protein IWZ01DRAFT_491138 [Phyllosticta capitalensis]
MQQARSSLPHLGDDGRQDSATADKVAEIEECLPTYQCTYVPTHRTLATQQVARNSQPASERCRATLSKQERRIRFACAAGLEMTKQLTVRVEKHRWKQTLDTVKPTTTSRRWSGWVIKGVGQGREGKGAEMMQKDHPQSLLAQFARFGWEAGVNQSKGGGGKAFCFNISFILTVDGEAQKEKKKKKRRLLPVQLAVCCSTFNHTLVP